MSAEALSAAAPIASTGWRDLLADGRGPVLALIVLGCWVTAADALVTATIMPSVGAALDAIALPSCVASSASHEKMRFTLGHTGLWDRFAGRIFSATEVAHGKPAPDLFLHAAATMGWEPADCAVVEDSPAGVEAGLSAGMTVFGYAGTTPASRLDGARVFTDMAELPGLLQPS